MAEKQQPFNPGYGEPPPYPGAPYPPMAASPHMGAPPPQMGQPPPAGSPSPMGPPPPGTYPPPPMAYPPPPGQPGYQQGGYPAPPPMVQPSVVVVQNMNLGFYPTAVTCPYCQQLVTTRVDYETGGLTWLAVGGLALIGCWGGCCLIPFCINDLKDCHHICPSCSKTIATKRRL